MNIELIQDWVKSLLDANAALTASGAVKLMDDGTYPKTPSRESALNEGGLVIVVWEPDGGQLLNMGTTGTGVQEIYVPILIEENVTVNRTPSTGTEMPALEAARHVQAALSGKRPAANSPFVLLPVDSLKRLPPFNGVQQVLCMFSINSAISPA